MPTVNWTELSLDLPYVQFFPTLREMFENACVRDFSSDENIFTNTIRWNNTSGYYQRYNGSSWDELEYTSISVDSIAEKTADNGVSVEGVTLKDNDVSATDITANTAFLSNTISERTGGSGVTIDSAVFKDNNASASTLTSTVSTGTAPLSVTSETKVSNLNASYLEGEASASHKVRAANDTDGTVRSTTNSSWTTIGSTSVTINVPSGYYVLCLGALNMSASSTGSTYGAFRIYNSTQAAAISYGEAWIYPAHNVTTGHSKQIALHGVNTGMSTGNNTYVLQMKRGSETSITVYADDMRLDCLAFPYRS